MTTFMLFYARMKLNKLTIYRDEKCFEQKLYRKMMHISLLIYFP
jgi:hypothetical protein